MAGGFNKHISLLFTSRQSMPSIVLNGSTDRSFTRHSAHQVRMTIVLYFPVVYCLIAEAVRGTSVVRVASQSDCASADTVYVMCVPTDI